MKKKPHPKLYHTVIKYKEESYYWQKRHFDEQLTLRKPGHLKHRINKPYWSHCALHCVELYSGEVVASNFDLPQATWYQVTAFPMRDAALRGEHHEAGLFYLRRRVEQAQLLLDAALARSSRIAGLGKQISEAREKQQLAEEEQEKTTTTN